MTQPVQDFSSVGIGSADPGGVVLDHSGVHIGSADRDGEVTDFAGVHIGRVVPGARPADASAPGAPAGP
jgi:hypothetical protein